MFGFSGGAAALGNSPEERAVASARQYESEATVKDAVATGTADLRKTLTRLGYFDTASVTEFTDLERLGVAEYLEADEGVVADASTRRRFGPFIRGRSGRHRGGCRFGNHTTVFQPECDAWWDGGGQRWCVGVSYCTPHPAVANAPRRTTPVRPALTSANPLPSRCSRSQCLVDQHTRRILMVTVDDHFCHMRFERGGRLTVRAL